MKNDSKMLHDLKVLLFDELDQQIGSLELPPCFLRISKESCKGWLRFIPGPRLVWRELKPIQATPVMSMKE